MAKADAKTKDTTAPQQEPLKEAPKSNVPSVSGPRIPYHPMLQERFGIGKDGWRVLVESTFPSAKTIEGIILALSYCKARNLDVFKRPCNVVAVWNSALQKEVESVWVGINESRTTAARTGQYAGCDETVFGDDVEYTFTGRVKQNKEYVDKTVIVKTPAWARVTVYRLIAGQRCAFPGPRIHYLAAYGKIGKAEVPNDKWERSASYMLEKVAEAAALRKAFPEECGDYTAEEMEGQVIDGRTGEITEPPPSAPPPRPTRQPDPQAAKDGAREMDQAFRNTSPPVNETVIEHETAAAEEPAKATNIDDEPMGPTAKMLTAKFADCRKMEKLDAVLHDYAEEIKTLADEAPQRHAKLLAYIDERRTEIKAKQ